MKRKKVRIVSFSQKKDKSSKHDLTLILVLFFVSVLSIYNILSLHTDNSSFLSNDTPKYTSFATIIEDGIISDKEADYLSSLNCEELKKLLNVNKSACVYLTDEKGNLMPLGDNLFSGCSGCFE